jgi:hypothetical protein
MKSQADFQKNNKKFLLDLIKGDLEQASWLMLPKRDIENGKNHIASLTIKGYMFWKGTILCQK